MILRSFSIDTMLEAVSIDTITIVKIFLSCISCWAFLIFDNLILLLILLLLLIIVIVVALILMVFDFAIEIDEVLAGLCQTQLKILPIEVFLHVLVALLKFSDYDFLSFI